MQTYLVIVVDIVDAVKLFLLGESFFNVSAPTSINRCLNRRWGTLPSTPLPSESPVFMLFEQSLFFSRGYPTNIGTTREPHQRPHR